MYHIFFIHFSVDRRLSCFHVLAAANSAATNIWVPVSLRNMFFSSYMFRSGIVISYGRRTGLFLGKNWTGVKTREEVNQDMKENSFNPAHFPQMCLWGHVGEVLVHPSYHLYLFFHLPLFIILTNLCPQSF